MMGWKYTGKIGEKRFNFRKKTIYFQNVNSVNTLYEQPLGYDDIHANNLTKHSCDVSTVFKSIHLDEVRYLK